MILRVRRGLEANRTLFTPSLGEPLFTTDTKRLYIGDGVTPGGIPVDTEGDGGGGGGDGADYVHRADTNNPHSVTKAQVGLADVPNTDFTAAVAANTAKRTYPLADQNKLTGVESGATANDSDAALRARSSHTGSQPISSITNLQSELNAKQAAGDYATSTDVSNLLNNKVDKVTGKQLSTEDYTTIEKAKLADTVAGAASSMDNALPRFDGTDGKTLQSSGVAVSDTDDIQAPGYVESAMLVATPLVVADEIVEYYDDAGILIDGVLVKDGLVSGRDVALDGYKLDSVESGAEVNAVTSVNGQTGDVVVAGEGGTTDHGLLTGLADDDHTQYHTDARGDARYYQKSEVDTQLLSKSPTSHNHDDLYTPLGHTHTEADITDLGDYATSAELSSGLSGKANTSHAHPISDITATGTRSSSTYLRGDGTFATPPNTNTTYAVPSQAEAEAGTATTARAFSAQRVNQAIQALAPVKSADLATKLDKTGGTVTGSLDVDGDIYSNGSKVAKSVDFSTSEQDTGMKWINGKPIYQKTVYISSLPDNTSTGYTHGISNIEYITKVSGVGHDGTNWTPMPFLSQSSPIPIFASTSTVTVQTSTNRSSWQAYITLQYTKT